jgi:ankyrin repeat protein
MNSSGETVLHLAVKCGNQKAVECLLQHNVDMYKRVGDNNDSKLALDSSLQETSLYKRFLQNIKMKIQVSRDLYLVFYLWKYS